MGRMSLGYLLNELEMIRAYLSYCTMIKDEQDVLLQDLNDLIVDLKENGIES